MIIESRYNGPPNSGNGGYTAGLLAGHLGAVPAEVTLRRPPPLSVPLTVAEEGGVLRATIGNSLVAEARPLPAEDAPDPVDGVDFAAAVEASRNYPGFTAHPFPTCFVCGPDRDDGLRLFPGVLPDGRTAAPWRVPDDVSPVLMWAALDCPGGWSVLTEGRPYVLGRMAAWVDAVAEPGAECVVTGQHVADKGRTATVLSTVHGPDGAVLARARATWVAI